MEEKDKKPSDEELKARTIDLLKMCFNSGQTYYMMYLLQPNPKYPGEASCYIVKEETFYKPQEIEMCSVYVHRHGKLRQMDIPIEKHSQGIRTYVVCTFTMSGQYPVTGARVASYSSIESLVNDGWRTIHEDKMNE